SIGANAVELCQSVHTQNADLSFVHIGGVAPAIVRDTLISNACKNSLPYVLLSLVV
nr:hypothetical protein [Tanacetum cinerariifolium]